MAKKKVKKEPDKGKDFILVAGSIFIVAVLIWVIINQPGEEKPQPALEQKTPTTTVAPAVRKPAVAGSFYTKDKDKLSAEIDKYLADAKPQDVWGIRGLVSPHAGYVYSGPVAAYGYKGLMRSRYETVIVMGPSHHVYLQKAYIPDVDYFETPLGRVPLSPKVKEMLKDDLFTSQPAGADGQEHSIEVQLPFLQKVLPPFKLIPIMVGDVDPKELAETLSRYVDDDTLVIASSDLSHYKPYDECVATDNVTVSAIVALDWARMAKDGDACGKIPVMALMELAKERDWRSNLFDYRNSGDTSGDKSQGVVGYSSIGFYDGLNEDEQQALLKIAEETLAKHYLGAKYEVDEGTLPPKLLEEKGCFVTLNEDRQLRGCIGYLEPQGKLYMCVMQNALNAALNDGRFNPVSKEELGDIRIEVSVLTEPKPLVYESPDDLLAKLIPGVDGVILRSGYRQSTYLPVVWEMLPGKEEFLSELCRKGGSASDCWKKAEVETYQAQEFHQDGFR